MRTAQKQLRRTQVSKTLSVSSPVAGWNARDPISAMQDTDAVTLDNFFCTPYDVLVRSGCSNWATGITGTVNTVTSYSPPSSVLKLFAYALANVYDITVSGAVSAPVLTGFTSDKWQHINFGTAGGDFLICANGSDLPIVYSGAGWNNIGAAVFPNTTSLTSVGTLATVTTASAHALKTGMSVVVAGWTPAGYNGTYIITVTGANTFTFVLAGALGVTTVSGTIVPLGNYVVTGVNPALFIQPAIFKSRLWFVERNSLRVWYLPALSLGGAAQVVDLTSVFSRGGFLMTMGDWSLDAGYGLDDYAVFISSEGQVAVYRGTDPASISTWALVGVFDVGSPIGRRCIMKYAGDLTLISQDGLAPLSQALMSSRVNSKEMLTDKIQHVISDYTTTYGNNFGWECALFPQQNMLLMNVPIGTTTSYQVVMNTISGAWSRFLGWNATCFELHNNLLFFGTAGMVCKAWDTQSDSGTNINFEAQQSFNYFGGHAQLKQVKMLRPIISTDNNLSILLGVNVDFDTSSPTGIPTFSPSTSALWDVATWDGIFTWSGDLQIKKEWQTSFGMGYAISAHIKGSTSIARLHWASTDYLVSDGGVI